MSSLLHAPLVAALVLHPAMLRTPVPRSRGITPCASSSSLWANDGGDGEIDWDKEAAALALPANKFYKEMKSIPVPDLVSEFAKSAPAPVQFAMRMTVAQLLGNMPPEVAKSSLTTTGQNIASLMMSMQMTGYMFRNAEYRRSLVTSLKGGEEAAALPPVKGKIGVKFGEGLVTEVDAASYMAELRAEVEGLRTELAARKRGEEVDEPSALIKYMQTLSPSDAQELTKSVSGDVLEAMQQLISSILKDINVDTETLTEVPSVNMREMLIWQLISGYKLREMEVRDELKDQFWGADGAGADGAGAE